MLNINKDIIICGTLNYEFLFLYIDGYHVPGVYPTTVRGHKMDAALWFLYNLLSTIDENLESVIDVQGEICT